jgi:hypothetical protein
MSTVWGRAYEIFVMEKSLTRDNSFSHIAERKPQNRPRPPFAIGYPNIFPIEQLLAPTTSTHIVILLNTSRAVQPVPIAR